MTSVSGTRGFQCPAQVAKQPYNGIKSDIFSLGVSLFMMVTGMSPFNEASEQSKLYCHVINGDFKKYFEVVQKYSLMEFSPELKDLL